MARLPQTFPISSAAQTQASSAAMTEGVAYLPWSSGAAAFIPPTASDDVMHQLPSGITAAASSAAVGMQPSHAATGQAPGLASRRASAEPWAASAGPDDADSSLAAPKRARH